MKPMFETKLDKKEKENVQDSLNLRACKQYPNADKRRSESLDPSKLHKKQ